MEKDRVDRRQGGNRMQGNSESFPFLWQNLVFHSEAISGGPLFIQEPGLLEGQHFPVSENGAKGRA